MLCAGSISFLFLLRLVSLCCQTTIVSSLYIHLFFPFAVSLKVLFYLFVVCLLWYRQLRGIYDQLLSQVARKSPRRNFILNIICKRLISIHVITMVVQTYHVQLFHLTMTGVIYTNETKYFCFYSHNFSYFRYIQLLNKYLIF